MIAQEIQIEIFLFNPSDTLFSSIDNKELALRLLSKLPDSIKKCHFLWSKGYDNNTRIKLIKMCLENDNSKLFYELMGDFDSSVMDAISECAAKYGRLDELKFLLGKYNYSLYRIVESAAQNGRIEEVKFLLGECNPNEQELYKIVESVAKNGHKELLSYLYYKYDIINLTDIIFRAAENGHQEIVNFLIDVEDCEDYYLIASSAIGGNHVSLFRDMIKRGISRYGWNIITTSDDINDWTVVNRSDLDSWNWIASGVAKGGYLPFLNKMIESGANDWNMIAKYAASGGHREIVKDMVERGADDFNEIAEYAIDNGYKDIVMDMIPLGINDWDYIASGAAKFGYPDLLEIAINNGANMWGWIIGSAIEGDNINLVRILMELDTNRNSILKAAVKHGNKEIVDLILKERYGLEYITIKSDYESNTRINIIKKCLGDGNEILFIPLIKKFDEVVMSKLTDCAVKEGRLREMDYLREKNSYPDDSFRLSAYAARGGHRDILDYFIERGADNWNEIAWNAAEGGYIGIMNEMINGCVISGFHVDYNTIASVVIKNGHMFIAHDLIKRGVDNWNMIASSMAESGDRKLLYKLIKKGSYNWNMIAEGAARGGELEIVLDMIKRGANSLNEIAKNAALYDHKDVVLAMIDKGANNWEDIVCYAAKYNHIALFDIAMERGTTNWVLLRWVPQSVAEGGHLEMARKLMKVRDIDNLEMLKCAAEFGHREIVDLILKERFGLD